MRPARQGEAAEICDTTLQIPLSVTSMPFNRWLLALTVAVLYGLHQDVWFWRQARPLVFGFLPAGLAYHAAFTLAACLLMVILVRLAWPSHLERD